MCPDLALEALRRLPAGAVVLRLENPGDAGSLRTLFANAAASHATGQNLLADVGQTMADHSPELAESPFAAKFLHTLETGERSEWETEYGDSRVERGWFRGSAVRLDDRTLVVHFENITHAKRLEQRRARLTAELERSNEDLDQFAYVASHDLQAPLRDIENLASWLEEDAAEHLPEPSLRHLDLLRGRVRRMGALLSDLLDYSRAGRVFSPPETIPVDDVLRAIEALLPRPDGFRLEVPDAAPTLYGPRQPLEVVLRNLIANAIKHHDRPDGRIRVTVSEPEDGLVTFAVADDGPGIAPAFHDRVFQMFQTLVPRDRVEGTGLGLALVARLVEAHGGTVGLESDAGAGATFRFTWPVRWEGPQPLTGRTPAPWSTS